MHPPFHILLYSNKTWAGGLVSENIDLRVLATYLPKCEALRYKYSRTCLMSTSKGKQNLYLLSEVLNILVGLIIIIKPTKISST